MVKVSLKEPDHQPTSFPYLAKGRLTGSIYLVTQSCGSQKVWATVVSSNSPQQELGSAGAQALCNLTRYFGSVTLEQT